MKIEDVLKKLIEAKEDEVSQLYPDGREALLEYITTLQRKEYNNSKAIEYCDREIGNIIANFDYVDTKDLQNVKNILEKGE